MHLVFRLYLVQIGLLDLTTTRYHIFTQLLMIYILNPQISGIISGLNALMLDRNDRRGKQRVCWNTTLIRFLRILTLALYSNSIAVILTSFALPVDSRQLRINIRTGNIFFWTLTHNDYGTH